MVWQRLPGSSRGKEPQGVGLENYFGDASHGHGHGDNVGEVKGRSMITGVNDHSSSLTRELIVDNMMRIIQHIHDLTMMVKRGKSD